MKVGILGTGVVGDTLGTKIASLGHEVKMGSRSATNEKALAWQKKAGAKASVGTFADAATFGEILFNCTSGKGALEALKLAGAANMKGKVLVDVSNPLDFSRGFPPSLTVCNTDSLAEQIQRAYPETKVVKSLNTVSAPVMIEPGKVANGEHTIFVCGNDGGARGKVKEILTGWFGWKHVMDLGDITTARGTEMYLALWVEMFGVNQSPMFNVHVVK
ncbi:MAG TPA: NAD(P)-binding domain-containing protein [bacterium]|nr:NAD(P)-binding domain-containing protein [bacterium]